MRPPKGKGAKAKLRTYIESHPNTILDSSILQEVGDSSEWARRLRELREDEGYEILSHIDRSDLKPGEYFYTGVRQNKPRPSFSRGISKKTRAFVLDRNGFTCQMCGAAAGEPNPYDGRPTKLHIGHIVDKAVGGTDEPENLRALCSVCNEGAATITQPRPDADKLLQPLRRSTGQAQQQVLEWLVKKYPQQARQMLQRIEGQDD